MATFICPQCERSHEADSRSADQYRLCPSCAKRHCVIVSASVEDVSGGGDGAYGLLDVSGSPEEIGRAIAEELSTSDLIRGASSGFCGTIANGDGELYLTVRIKFARHPVEMGEND